MSRYYRRYSHRSYSKERMMKVAREDREWRDAQQERYEQMVAARTAWFAQFEKVSAETVDELLKEGHTICTFLLNYHKVFAKFENGAIWVYDINGEFVDRADKFSNLCNREEMINYGLHDYVEK